MGKINCEQVVKDLKDENLLKEEAIKQAYDSKDLWEKCVLLRAFTGPQSHLA